MVKIKTRCDLLKRWKYNKNEKGNDKGTTKLTHTKKNSHN